MAEKEKKVLVGKKAKVRSNALKDEGASESIAKREEALRLPSLSFLTSTTKLECTFGEEKADLVGPVTKRPLIAAPFWLQDIVRDEKAEDQGVRLLFNL